MNTDADHEITDGLTLTLSTTKECHMCLKVPCLPIDTSTTHGLDYALSSNSGRNSSLGTHITPSTNTQHVQPTWDTLQPSLQCLRVMYLLLLRQLSLASKQPRPWPS